MRCLWCQRSCKRVLLSRWKYETVRIPCCMRKDCKEQIRRIDREIQPCINKKTKVKLRRVKYVPLKLSQEEQDEITASLEGYDNLEEYENSIAYQVEQGE